MIIPPDRRGEERVILGRILNGERIEHYETRRLAKDGTILDVSLAISPVTDESNVIVGASVVGRDIRGRKRREALEREVEKRDFIARAAHELKNPLTAIAGMTQVLRDNRSSLSADDKEKVYDSLIRQSERANRLITDLLELARLESGQLEIQVASVDLHDVVSSAIEAVAAPAEFSVSSHVEAGSRVRADPFRLEEVLVNLFSNSAKYGASSVAVTVSRSEEMVHVVVADDGPGIAGDFVPTLFEPFTRDAPSDVAGSGLGLSIAKRLCEAFGGDIRFEPNQPTGAAFVLTLSSG